MLKLCQFCCVVRSIFKSNQTNLTTTSIFYVFYHKISNNNNVHLNKSPINPNMYLNCRKGFEMVARQWEDTKLGKKYRANHKKYPGCPFIVMSYNILAQLYIEYHRDLYRGIHNDFLQWEYRLKNIIQELSKNRPHILCLQEVQVEHYAAIKNGLQLENMNYKAIYHKKTGDKSDGCAIFYDKEIFQIQSHRNLNLYSKEEQLLGRDNIAILLKLSLKSNLNKSFTLVNTHLLYNPKRDDVRLAQLQTILTALKDFTTLENNRSTSVIMVGDYNFSPTSSLYEFITKGSILWNGSITNMCRNELNAKSKSETESKSSNSANNFLKTAEPNDSQSIAHSFKLESSLSPEQLRRRATTYHREWIVVDHIFYSNDAKSNLKLLSTYLPPQIRECFPIPNAQLGSDHHFVAANFLLT